MTGPTRRTSSVFALATTLALGVGAAGCSSSSSDGSPSASGTTSSAPAPTKTLKAQGPAGNTKPTAPTTIAPTSGAPAGSEVFPHISTSRSKHLTAKVLKLPGVLRATYYTNFHQLQVYFKPGVTSDQRQAIERAVAAG